jgi:pimeloyl-[acyl-carrier protein] methyl ester esterase
MTACPASQQRPPVFVMLHGFALHAGLWGDWPAELGSRTVRRAIDLPGHGLRAWDTRIRDLGGFARAVSDQVPPGAIVLGWSLGGMIALELARQRPSTLGGLVLIATTPRFVAGADWPHGIEPGVFETFAEDVRRDYHRTVQDFLALQVLGTADPRATLRALRAAVRSRPAPDPRALETGLDILRRADLRETLRDIELETLVITGQHDRLAHPSAGEFLATALPGGRWLRIAGAGHAPFLSHPLAMADELTAFLDRLRLPAARPSMAAG